ncbi:MAG: MerR family transcriptional regulator, partial [Longimicrobiales bacterium]|nr:MerR family transcriptional regulator [Longimicrobiales bacterium]
MNPPSDPRHPRHPIRVVADRTGLNPTLLRAWERRYGVVDPGRSDGGQRLYSDADVARAAVEAGASLVNDVRGLRDAALRAACAELGVPAVV